MTEPTAPDAPEATPMLLTEDQQAVFNSWIEHKMAATSAPTDPFAGLQPGRIVLYEPPAHHARHVAGPWVAIVTATQDAGVVTLAVFPPMPVPVGTDPVARLEAVHYSESGEPGTWHWPVRA